MFVTSHIAILFILAILNTGSQANSCEPGYQENGGESQEEIDTAHEDTHRTPLNTITACTSDGTRTYLAETEGSIPVNCGKCSIYKLDVIAKSDKGRYPRMCMGLTMELFSSSKDCMWKNNCILPYTPSYIAWSPPDQPSCLGEVPNTVDVNLSCLDPAMAIDDVLKGYQTIESVNGLIRVHSKHSRSETPYETNLKSHILDITPPADLRDSWKNYFVMLYVVTSNNVSTDSLILRDASSRDDRCLTYQISTWLMGDIHTRNLSSLRFRFQVNSSSSTDTSIDICFQWFDHQKYKSRGIFNETIKLCRNGTRKDARESVRNGTRKGAGESVRNGTRKGADIPTFDVIKTSTTNNRKGIIRSHSTYPWNYPRPIRTKNDCSLCKWASYVHVLKAPNDSRYLTMEAAQIDLGRNDSLVVTFDKQEGKQLWKPGRYNFSGESVTLNFSVLYSTAHTNSGFLLCYAWSKARDETGSEDLCHQFAYKVSLCGKQSWKNLRKKCGLKERNRRKDTASGENSKKNPQNRKHGQTQSPKNNDRKSKIKSDMG